MAEEIIEVVKKKLKPKTPGGFGSPRVTRFMKGKRKYTKKAGVVYGRPKK